MGSRLWTLHLGSSRWAMSAPENAGRKDEDEEEEEVVEPRQAHTR